LVEETGVPRENHRTFVAFTIERYFYWTEIIMPVPGLTIITLSSTIFTHVPKSSNQNIIFIKI
jgi:hypothetical protein